MSPFGRLQLDFVDKGLCWLASDCLPPEEAENVDKNQGELFQTFFSGRS